MISQEELSQEKSYLGLMWQYVMHQKRNFILTIIMLILNTIIAVTAPLFFNNALQTLETTLETDQSTHNLFLFIGALALYFILTVMSWFSEVSVGIVSTRLNAGIIGELRQDVFESLLLNDISFFDNTESGNIVSILTADLNELYDTGNAIAQVSISLLQLIGVIAILLNYSVTLTLSSLGILPIFLIVTVIIRLYRRTAERTWRRSFGAVNHSFAETLRSIEVSKAFNREEENVEHFRILNESTYTASIKRGAAIFISQPVGDFLRNVLLVMILFIGSYIVENNGLSVAHYYLFIFLLDYYYQPINAIARNYQQFQSLFANLERVLSVAHFEENQERSTGNIELKNFTGEVRFDHVNFSYTNDIQVLDDINFTIKAGSRVALVGHTGSGKTTIASLITRLYDINSGQILIDNVPHSSYDPHSLRSNIGMVSQDILLFKGTILDNLRLATPDVTEEEIWEAIDAVQAREFIESLPEGLKTTIDEDAKNLSVGQRQMLSFARTLISKPKLILLDEATSSVDLYTEAKIQEATDLLLRGTTSLVIAHRLTTIIRSDLIVVLDKGCIREMGTHDELLLNNGSYKEMYDLYFKTQSAKYLESIKR